MLTSEIISKIRPFSPQINGLFTCFGGKGFMSFLSSSSAPYRLLFERQRQLATFYLEINLSNIVTDAKDCCNNTTCHSFCVTDRAWPVITHPAVILLCCRCSFSNKSLEHLHKFYVLRSCCTYTWKGRVNEDSSHYLKSCKVNVT